MHALVCNEKTLSPVRDDNPAGFQKTCHHRSLRGNPIKSTSDYTRPPPTFPLITRGITFFEPKSRFMNIRGGIIRAIPENARPFFDRLNSARGMPVSANSPNNPESADEPETITDLSELAFDFEEVTPSNRRPVYGSTTDELMPGELSEELELLDSLAGQITGDGPPEFYCKSLGQVLGPMSLAELRIMAESGALSADDLVRYGENGDWKLASSFSRLAESLHRGSSITAEPVSSAPPSTRRLFQTGYKPTGDSFGEETSGSGIPDTGSSDNAARSGVKPETATVPSVPVAEAGSGVAEPAPSSEKPAEEGSEAVNSSDVKPDAKSESEASAVADPRRKRAAKKSAATKKASKKSAGKKKPAKKRNDEDDAILNEIFSEVFADDQKTQRAAMPPAAGASSSTPDASTGASPSSANDASAKPPATT